MKVKGVAGAKAGVGGVGGVAVGLDFVQYGGRTRRQVRDLRDIIGDELHGCAGTVDLPEGLVQHA